MCIVGESLEEDEEKREIDCLLFITLDRAIVCRLFSSTLIV